MSERLTECGGSIAIGRESRPSHLAYASGDSAALGLGGYPWAVMSWSESCRAASSVSAGRIFEPLGVGTKRSGAGMPSVGDAAMRRCNGCVVTASRAVQSSCR